MRFSTLLLIFLFSQSIAAQRFTIDLSEFELSVPISFKVDSIIDARITPETLGYIFNKKTKNYATVFPTKTVDSSLTTLLQKRSGITGESLTLRLNRMFVYQKSRYGKRSLAAEVSITFINKLDGKYYELFTSTKTIRKEVKYGNKLAGVFVQQALDSCLFHYEKRKAAGKLNNNPLEETSLASNYSTDQAPLMKMPYFKKGLFYSYYDLRDCVADSETNFEVDLQKVGYHEPREAKLKFEDKAMRKKDIYAFSNGSSLFLNTGKYYTEIIDTAGGLWLNQHPDFPEITEYNTGAMIAIGIAGGMLGVGIYAIIADSPDNSNKYLLDLERGCVVPQGFPEPGKVTSQILFYGSSFLSESDTLSLRIDQNEPIKLWRDQYFVYEADDKCLPVKACLSIGNKDFCEEITPIILNTAMVRCQISRDKGKIEVLPISRQTEIKEAIKSGTATRIFQ